MAVRVEQDLDLDVAGPGQEPLEDEAIVAEGRRRLAPGRLERIDEGPGRIESIDDPHALATAPSGRLDQDRVPGSAATGASGDPSGCFEQRRIGLVVAVVAGHDRNSEAGGEPAGRRLVAHRPDRSRRRPDPADAGSLDGLGEVGVLGQEAKPGVKGIGAGCPGRAHDRRAVEQVHRRSGARPGHDHPDAEGLGRASDPDRDLAPVGDEEGPDWIDLWSREAFAGRPSLLVRVNRVRSDTPPATNAPGRERSVGDPALHGPGRGPEALGDLAWRQLIGHRDAIVAF